MLTVGIKQAHPCDFSVQALSESCLDRFTFAAILLVNDDFSSGFACALGGGIARAVINHEHAVESPASSTNDVADMFFVVIRRNNRGGLRTDLSERIALPFCHRRTIG